MRTVDYTLTNLEFLKQERTNWEPHWQELADYIIPRKNDILSFVTPGTKRNTNILDNTAMVDNELLAGTLHGMLTNPSSVWFEMTTGDDKLDQDDQVRTWLQDTVLRMHVAMNNTNFQTEVHEFYLDLCSFCTASMTVLEDAEKDFTLQSQFIKEIFIRENSKGIVDEVTRCFSWEARKIVQEFGIEAVTDEVRAQYESGKNDKFEIVHCTYPNENYGTKKQTSKDPIISEYILVKDKKLLRKKGFQEMPWLVARWSKASGEVYGRGPGMNALPTAKMLNLMEETVIRGAQKTIDPPLQAPDDGFVGKIKTRPASINYYRAGGSKDDRITPIYNDARIDYGLQVLEAHRKMVHQAFYVDQLQLQQDRGNMTATEVNARTDEKMRFLGPLLGRLQVEFLAPLIDRVFAIMLRRGRFLPPPAVLQGRKLDVRYSSVIAKMQRAAEVASIFETMQAIAPFVQIMPEVTDNFDGDAAARGIAAMKSFPQKFLKDVKERDQIRAGRAQAQQKQQQMMEEANTATNIGKAGPAVVQAQQAGQEAGI